MLRDLRSVLGRHTAIELMITFTLAGAVVAFVTSVVNDLVVTPINSPVTSADATSLVTSGVGPLQFVIDNRIFDTERMLYSGLALLVLLALAALYVRFHEDALWRDEGGVTTCPHCLSEIPAEARVCSQCTRDVGSAATPS